VARKARTPRHDTPTGPAEAAPLKVVRPDGDQAPTPRAWVPPGALLDAVAELLAAAGPPSPARREKEGGAS
jgi:hypothetical protein